MSWLLYLSAENSHVERLLKTLDPLCVKSNVEICRSPQDFSRRLQRPFLDFRVMVLFIASKEALREILLLGDFLSDMKIILVLPDDEQDTRAQGFTLSPRFTTSMGNDFSNLGDVLKKMLDLYDGPGC